jgi:hypothetical protein
MGYLRIPRMRAATVGALNDMVGMHGIAVD